MTRPRRNSRGLRSIATVAAGAAIVFFAFETPAQAASITPGTVAVGVSALKVRAAPRSASAAKGSLRAGAKLSIACQVIGEPVSGRVRSTNRWDKLTSGNYVSDAFVSRRTTVPLCGPVKPVNRPATSKPATKPKSGQPISVPAPVLYPPITGGKPVGTWVKPLTDTTTIHYEPTSGYRSLSRPNHDGVDIPAARNTAIVATADGVVHRVVCNTSGPSCDVDGSPSIKGCGWYVEILHAENVITRYCHLVRRPDVVVDQLVTAGQQIGLVGTSGSSSGPHLHFEIHAGNTALRLNAVDPVEFMQRAGASLIDDQH